MKKMTVSSGSPFVAMFSKACVLMVANSIPNNRFLDWFELKSFCRRQNKCNFTTDVLFGKGRKHCGKRRKCWLPAFSPFLTVFSKGFFFRVLKSRDYVV